MKTIKTSELSGAALDWAVAKCEGEDYSHVTTYSGIGQEFPPTNYSTDWAQGGPIIEREKISTQELDGVWSAFFRDKLFEEDDSECWRDGPTPLIAAMRCYVASKFGDTVEVPDELAVQVRQR